MANLNNVILERFLVTRLCSLRSNRIFKNVDKKTDTFHLDPNKIEEIRGCYFRVTNSLELALTDIKDAKEIIYANKVSGREQQLNNILKKFNPFVVKMLDNEQFQCGIEQAYRQITSTDRYWREAVDATMY